MTRDLVETALTQGESTLMGDIPRASNATSLVVVESGEHTLKAVYKPMSGSGRAGLPRGTLGTREVASYRLSRHLDLGVVPRPSCAPTSRRDPARRRPTSRTPETTTPWH